MISHICICVYTYIMYIHYTDRENEYERPTDKENPQTWASKRCEGPPCWEAYGNKLVYFHARFMRGGLAQ